MTVKTRMQTAALAVLFPKKKTVKRDRPQLNYDALMNYPNK